jgi:cholest-4-en-3-one 26-monooxygenase
MKAPIDLLDLDRFQRSEHHEMFRKLRAEAPVSWHDHPGGRGFWNVVKHADVVEVGRDADRFSSEAQGVNGMLAFEDDPSAGPDTRGVMLLYMDPPKHSRYRRLVNRGFTPRMVRALEEHLRRKATLIVDGVIERGSCDFVEEVAAELPLQALAEIMGVPQEDRHLLFDWSNRMVGVDDPDHRTDDGSNAMGELYAYVNQLAKQRREDPRNDIVTTLINAEVDGDTLTEAEFDLFMLLLTVAGNETTRNTTSLGMLALMQHPDSLAELRRDPALLPPAIEEILRWASPVHYFRRTALTETTIRGTTIAAGDQVIEWYVSANRDEEVFDDPFTFDITRAPNEHVAFGGGGPHFCLGANLARVELRLIFREILDRMVDVRPAGEPQFLRSNFIGGLKHLPITFEPGRREG